MGQSAFSGHDGAADLVEVRFWLDHATGLDPFASRHAFHTVPTTDDELHAWVYHFLGIWIPRVACCQEHVAPFTAFAHAYFARDPICIWHASRGYGGKSFLLATLVLTEAITLGAATSILGGSLEQSERVHSYLTGEDPNAQGKFWDSPRAPAELIASDLSKRSLRLTNGAFVKALAASGRSVRGPHPQRLRLDECDEMDIKIFDAAMGQTMAARGIVPQTVCSSTHHIPDGTMTELLKRAKEREWPVFEWCYRENLAPHGWLAPSEIDRKKREVSKIMWDIEYELQEPSPEDRAIDPDSVRRLFDPSLGVFPGKDGLAHEVVLVKPHRLRRFYHGADWAKSSDWTIYHSMEETGAGGPNRLAAWGRMGRRPWPIMVDGYNRRVGTYGGESCHDATGVGEVCTDYLTVESTPFDFRNSRERADMLSSYIAGIENGDFVYPMIEYAYGEHLYATWKDVFGSSLMGGHLPDTIAAAALAELARRIDIGEYDPREWKSLKR